MKKLKYTYWIAGLALIILLATMPHLPNKSKSPAKATTPTGLISEANYLCNGDKQIKASYYEGSAVSVKPGEPPKPSGKVELALSDGRKITLPQTISGSGIRYATANESMIFWSKGDSVFIVENNVATYSNCNNK